MKHIESYKIFESSKKDIIQNCKDILLELDDERYRTRVRYFEKEGDDLPEEIEIEIIKGFNEFNKKDVEEYALRLVDYLATEGFKYHNYIVKKYSEVKSAMFFVEFKKLYNPVTRSWELSNRLKHTFNRT